MLKKYLLLISTLFVVVYLSLWYFTNHWIDNADELQFLSVNQKNSDGNKNLLNFAKNIYKITPAVNIDKDAERFLKLVSFSVLADVNGEFNESLSVLHANYKNISDYYEKNKEKLSPEMKNKFALKKLIFINRSIKTIKDNQFETSLINMYHEISQTKAEEQMSWYGELYTYYVFSNDTKNINKIYEEINKSDIFNKNEDLIILNFFHSGVAGCIHVNMYKKLLDDDYISHGLNNSKRYFSGANKLLEKRPTTKEIMISYFKTNLNLLSIKQMEGECQTDAIKIISKVVN